MEMNLSFDVTLEFYEKLEKHTNDRYRSFEHCYQYFQNLRNPISEEQLDLAMLHIGFYLASWGMYRGSSFLLQKDYKIFRPIVLKLLETEYEHLRMLDKSIRKDNIKELSKCVFTLHEELQNLFSNDRCLYYSYKNEPVPKESISSVLTTKVIMGSLGCIPAYDRYFKDGIAIYKKHNPEICLIQTFSENSIYRLFEFVLNSKKKLLELQKKVERLTKIEYPLLKLIDSYFWTIGYNDEIAKKEEQKKQRAGEKK